jgi:hypothetical protein
LGAESSLVGAESSESSLGLIVSNLLTSLGR